MKKLLLLILVLFAIGLGYSFANSGFFKGWDNKTMKQHANALSEKTPLVRIVLVADSENENDLLAKALDQAKGMGVNFVIGLGDWSQVGTLSELSAAKAVFDKSGLRYFLTAGDHDLWDSRNRGEDALTNYRQIFGEPTQTREEKGIHIVIVDNSDIYSGLSQKDWESLNSKLETRNSKLTFVFAHKTPFHPESAHVMGEDSPDVARQAKQFMDLMEAKKVAGFFSGDLHFFAQFKSPNASVKITTIGAVSGERNFQGPRFGILTVFDDYSWNVEDVDVRI